MASLSAIDKLLRPLVADLGYELLGLELDGHAKHGTLRLYIDQTDYSGEINLRDCEQVSREVAALLDVEDPLPGQYNLEVSSPGVDRPLFNADQFAAFAGQQAQLKLLVAQDGRRKLTGEIIAADDGQLTLRCDGQDIGISLADIRSARLVPDYKELLARDLNKDQRKKLDGDRRQGN